MYIRQNDGITGIRKHPLEYLRRSCIQIYFVSNTIPNIIFKYIFERVLYINIYNTFYTLMNIFDSNSNQ